MRTRAVLIAAALLALSAAPAAAGSFSALYAFGDSLSDAGNVYIATTPTGAPIPPAPPYALVNGFGVFSNGPVWVQDLARDLGLGPLLPSLAGGTDFAVGGASTGAFGAYRGSPGDLLPAPNNLAAESQIGMFTADVPHPAANALYTLSIGSNDIMTILARDAAHPLRAVFVAAAVIRNIATFVDNLAARGARNFDVLNVPDLGKAPAFRAQGPAIAAKASAFAGAFDLALEGTLAGLARSDGLDLHLIDSYALVDEAVADPTLFGLTNVTDACLPPGSLTPCATPDRYLFWDDLHPTETGHLALADLALDPTALTDADPVPEPGSLALLAAGLGMLGIAARRRHS